MKYVWFIVLLILIFLTSLQSSKNIAIITVPLYLIAIQLSRLASPTYTARIVNTGLCLTIIPIFSPVDMCLRDRDRFGVSVLPVVEDPLPSTVKMLKSKGQVLNRDYVAYSPRPRFVSVMSVLVFHIPGAQNVLPPPSYQWVGQLGSGSTAGGVRPGGLCRTG